MLAIKNNLMAENAARQLGKSYDALARSVERLSSGLRINSAKDDAAGMAVRELIRADVATLRQGSRNARDAVSMLQTAEGALGTIDDILVRMKELAEQASTGSYSSGQKGIMQDEFEELANEIDRIVQNTAFNENKLLHYSGAVAPTYNFHLGTTQTINVTAKKLDSATLGVSGQKEYISGLAVDATTDEYMKGAAATDSMEFSFTIGADTETFEVVVGTGKTLEGMKDAINSASRAAVDGWNAASIVTNAETGQSVLKVEAWKSGNAAITIDVDADADGTNDIEWGGGTVLDGTAVAVGNFVNVAGSGSIDLVNAATTALGQVTTAINTKDSARAEFGYLMNRLEAAISVIDNTAENLMAAESRISDVDVATEMAAMTRNQVLSQAGISMLGQANSMPQMALQLLRG